MKRPEVIVIRGLDRQFISVSDVAGWLATMAAADGVVTPREKGILKEFAEMFGLNPATLCDRAGRIAKGVELPEVLFYTPSQMKGWKFENFVVGLLPTDESFTLLSWRSDKTANHTYARDALLPDLEVSYKTPDTLSTFLIECKFRSTWSDNGIDISLHFDRYLAAAADKGGKLFIALGVGGNPSDPDEFLLIPADAIPSDAILHPDELTIWHCPKDPASISTRLLSRR